MKSQVYTEKEYKQLEKDNVVGVLYIVRRGRICSVPKRYYFDNLENAAHHYNRLCKYRPLFVA